MMVRLHGSLCLQPCGDRVFHSLKPHVKGHSWPLRLQAPSLKTLLTFESLGPESPRSGVQRACIAPCGEGNGGPLFTSPQPEDTLPAGFWSWSQGCPSGIPGLSWGQSLPCYSSCQGLGLPSPII